MYRFKRRNKKKTEQQTATPTVDIKAFKDQLDKSSELNRNLGLFSVGFFVYMLITTIGVSDRQLVLLDQAPTGIVLSQLLSLTLPVMDFAKYAPVMVLAIHLNLLLNLLEHAGKLYHWKSNMANTESDELLYQKQLHPFMFNQATIQSGSWVLGLTKVLVKMSAFTLPMLTLFYFEFRFTDLHMRWLTNWHWFIFSIDAVLVLGFYAKTFSPPSLALGFKHRAIDFFKYGLIPVRSLYLLGGYGKTLLMNIGRKLHRWYLIRKKRPVAQTSSSIEWSWKGFDLSRLLDQTAFVALVFAAFLYWFIVQTITHPTKYKSIVAYANEESWERVRHFYSDTAYQKDSLLSFVPGESAFKPNTLLKPPIPTLTVPKDVFAFSTPTTQEIIMAKQAGVSEDSIEFKFTKGINLQNRDFTLADFHDCHLIKAELDSSILNYANCSGIIGNDAQFSNCKGEKLVANKANLPNANFKNVEMFGVNFFETRMQRACFENSKMEISIFNKSKMNEVNFINSTLTGAKFYSGEMQNAKFNYANLHGAIFEFATIKGANFRDAKMQGCNFEYSKIVGVDFTFAEMQGVNLRSSDMQGADLSYANLQNADFSSSNMQGTVLTNSHLKACILIGFNCYETNIQKYFFNDCLLFLPNCKTKSNNSKIKSLDTKTNKFSRGINTKENIKMFNKNDYNIVSSINFPSIDDFVLSRKILLTWHCVPLYRIFFRQFISSDAHKYNDFIEKVNKSLKEELVKQKLYWRHDELNELAEVNNAVHGYNYPGITKLELPKTKNP